MPGNGVYQRLVPVAAARVHHEPGRLVHNHQLLVFIYDVERDVFRLYGVVVLGMVEHQGYYVERPDAVVALDRAVVYVHKPSIGSALYAVAAGVLQLFQQELVYSQRFLSFVHDNPQVLVKLLSLLVRYVFDVVFSHVLFAFRKGVIVCVIVPGR